MFTFQVCIILVGCVIAGHALSWRNFGYHHHSCGLEPGESMCPSSCSSSGKTCEPIVVRPQELPKPTITTALVPVPGPCGCKKAIVKPAILPKPVCHLSGHTCNEERLFEIGSCGCGSSHSFHGRPLHSGGCSHYGDEIFVNPSTGVYAPADAVSIAIAQQNADQLCNFEEDRLAFGFRKIPIEVPKQKIIKQNNIPEEKLFSLNGQIVELKPVKVGCSGKSLDEEAAEGLLALEEEETASATSLEAPIKKISLGELGYVPAKIPTKTFVDVPSSSESGTVVSEEAEECGSSSSLSGTSSLSGYRAGNVEYKTVAKPSTFTIGSDDSADCESSEGEQSVVYEEEHPHRTYGGGFYGGILPCGCPHVYHKCSSSSSSSSSSKLKKKASVIIQKLCSRD